MREALVDQKKKKIRNFSVQLSHKARKPVSQTVIPSFSHLYTSLGLENKVLFNKKNP